MPQIYHRYFFPLFRERHTRKSNRVPHEACTSWSSERPTSTSSKSTVPGDLSVSSCLHKNNNMDYPTDCSSQRQTEISPKCGDGHDMPRGLRRRAIDDDSGSFSWFLSPPNWAATYWSDEVGDLERSTRKNCFTSMSHFTYLFLGASLPSAIFQLRRQC